MAVLGCSQAQAFCSGLRWSYSSRGAWASRRLRFWFDEETVWVYVQDALATPTVIFQNRMYER